MDVRDGLSGGPTDLPCAEGWLLADGEKSLYLTDFRYGEEVENFFLGKETAVSVLPAEDFYYLGE